MIVNFPSNLTLVTGVEWGRLHRDLSFESIFGSGSAELSHPVWTALLTPARFNRAEYAEWEALLLSMEGRKNQLALWHLDRPQPLGTMRGAMTLNGAHAYGADVLNISAGAGQAGKTLLTGDHLGLGSGMTQQVFKVAADAVADVNGDVSVSVRSVLRNAFANGTAVTWDKPSALFKRVDSRISMKHARGGVDGTPLDMVEDWNP